MDNIHERIPDGGIPNASIGGMVDCRTGQSIKGARSGTRLSDSVTLLYLFREYLNRKNKKEVILKQVATPDGKTKYIKVGEHPSDG